jgi:zinc/manganese transport system substrate-binding protein
VNGAGYDPWADKLLQANPGNRSVVDVGKLVGVKEGGNPHLWYGPAYVHRVVARMTDDLKKADGGDAGYFDQRRATFEKTTLGTYDGLQAEIKQKYAGQPVGATESIFAYLARDLGLTLVTPPAFMDAISEGNEPTAADKATVDRQVAERQIKVLVYNKQNSTPDVDALVRKAKDEKIPVVSITETPDPAGTSFQDWQSSQLRSLQRALGQAAS